MASRTEYFTISNGSVMQSTAQGRGGGPGSESLCPGDDALSLFVVPAICEPF